MSEPERLRTAAMDTALRPVIPNAVLGMLFFLGAEVMFFAGLISAFLVLRASVETWPPVDQPRLPVVAAAVNTFVLLLSAETMRRARAAIGRGRPDGLRRWLAVTTVLAVTFLVVQGMQWIRLLRHGLGATSGAYGATFYTLTGAHALHVLAGVGVLSAVLWQALRGRCSGEHHAAVEACGLYWFFVAGIWPLLYGLVYLS